jgi:hypothetical protein
MQFLTLYKTLYFLGILSEIILYKINQAVRKNILEQNLRRTHF